MPKKINIQKLKELEASGTIDAKAAETLREMSNKGYNIDIDGSGDYKFVDKYGIQSDKRVGTRAGLLRGVRKKRRNVSDAIAKANQAGAFEDIKVELAPKLTGATSTGDTGSTTGTTGATGDTGTKDTDPVVTTVGGKETPTVATAALTTEEKAAKKAAADKADRERIARLTKKLGTPENEAATIQAANNATGLDFTINDGILQLVAPATPPPGTITTPTHSIMGGEDDEGLVPRKNNTTLGQLMPIYDNLYEFHRVKNPDGTAAIGRRDWKDKENHIQIQAVAADASKAEIKKAYDEYVNKGKTYDLHTTVGLFSPNSYAPMSLEDFTYYIQNNIGQRNIAEPTFNRDPLYKFQPRTWSTVFQNAEERIQAQKNLDKYGTGDYTPNRGTYVGTATKKSGGRLIPKAQGGMYVPDYTKNPEASHTQQRTAQPVPNWLGNFGISDYSNVGKANINYNNTNPGELQLKPRFTAQPQPQYTDPINTAALSPYSASDPRLARFNQVGETPGDEAPVKPAGNEKDDPFGDKLWKTPLGDLDPRELARMGVHTALTARPKLTGMTYGQLQDAPLLEGVKEQGLTQETSQMFDRNAADLQSQGANTAAQYSDPLLAMQGKLSGNTAASELLVKKAVANEEALIAQQNQNIATRNENLTTADTRKTAQLTRRDQQTAADVELKNQREGVSNTLRNTYRDSLTNLFKDTKNNAMVADLNTATFAKSTAESALDEANGMVAVTEDEIEAKRIAIGDATTKLKQAEMNIAKAQGVDTKTVLDMFGSTP